MFGFRSNIWYTTSKYVITIVCLSIMLFIILRSCSYKNGCSFLSAREGVKYKGKQKRMHQVNQFNKKHLGFNSLENVPEGLPVKGTDKFSMAKTDDVNYGYSGNCGFYGCRVAKFERKIKFGHGDSTKYGKNGNKYKGPETFEIIDIYNNIPLGRKLTMKSKQNKRIQVEFIGSPGQEFLVYNSSVQIKIFGKKNKSTTHYVTILREVGAQRIHDGKTESS